VDDLSEKRLPLAREAMTAAAVKAPGHEPFQFAPYLRAAITFWRLQEEAAQSAGDMTAHVEAVAERITHEDHFRRISGRSFHTVNDAISLDDINALPNPKQQ